MRVRKPPVTILCVICGVPREVPWNSRLRTCSRVCGRQLAKRTIDKVAFSSAISAGKLGKTHRGVPHSEETKIVLSQKTGERMRDHTRNPFIGKKRSLESREKQSNTRAKRFVDGSYEWMTWTEGGHVETKKAGKIWCRSSWEKDVAIALDADESVVTFDIEPFSVAYERIESGRKNLRRYVPDFLIEYIDGRKLVVEVKPPCHVTAAVNIAKFAAAREYCDKNCLEFVVWDRHCQRLA